MQGSAPERQVRQGRVRRPAAGVDAYPTAISMNNLNRAGTVRERSTFKTLTDLDNGDPDQLAELGDSGLDVPDSERTVMGRPLVAPFGQEGRGTEREAQAGIRVADLEDRTGQGLAPAVSILRLPSAVCVIASSVTGPVLTLNSTLTPKPRLP